MGVLPAREVAISTMELILRHRPKWKDTLPPDYELARLLRVSPRRLRGYLDEINFRNQAIDNVELDRRLRERLSRAERIRDGLWVAFEIEDALLRSYAQQKVRDHFGIVESGISGSVIRISGEQFAKLCLSVLTDAESRSILATLAPQGGAQELPSANPHSLASKVWEAFAVSAGKQAGKKAVDLGFMVASAGLSEIPSVLESLRGLLSSGIDGSPGIDSV